MTLRTKSKTRQWMAWLCAALAFFVVYVVLSQWLYNAVGWSPLDFRCHRLMLPLFALFVFVVRETRWDGIVREGRAKAKREGGAVEVRVRPPVRHASTSRPAPPSPPPTSIPAVSSSSAGEELFRQARAMPHQPIPDFAFDGEYLNLLGESAATGYAPALAKLGEYAMRRAAWVEAYYWMSRARRSGMHGLSPTLREIRQNWATVGFPDESKNVSELFPEESGSLGRALLHLDSGRDAAAAREFLKSHHPEFL